MFIRRAVVPVLLFMALYRFAGLSFGELQQWDEAIYALRARVIMLFGAIWDQSPYMLGGSYYSAHPPLQVWLTTIWTLIFGEGVWVMRLTSAVAGALVVWLTYRISRCAMSVAWALAAAGFVAFSPLLAFASRQGQLDMLLAACMLGSLAAAVRYVRGGGAGYIVLAALALGAALMTKMLFALSVPASLFVVSFVFRDERRSRARSISIASIALSLPLWLPWLWSFAVEHGDGNALFMFSQAFPLGATLTGGEGVPKDTGALYYMNQLLVHLSVLAPFALLSIYRAVISPVSTALIVLSAFSILQLCVLWIMKSSFEVYLIPVLPALIILAFAGVRDSRMLTERARFSLGLLSVACLAWSVSHAWRSSLKTLLGMGGDATASEVFGLFAMMSIVVAGAAVLFSLSRRGRLRRLLGVGSFHAGIAVLGVVTMWNIWVVHPSVYIDGAAAAVSAVKASGASHVSLVGNGDNPQLTLYFDGEDIGWHDTEIRYERLEPRAMGTYGILRHLERLALEERVAVIVELDEIAAGVYSGTADVLPDGYAEMLRTPRYVVALSHDGVNESESKGMPVR